MCDPITIAVSLAAVTSTLGVYSQYETSKQQNAAYEQNQKNAMRAQVDSYDAQAAQANQRRDAAGQQSFRNTLDAAKARATTEAAAADSGIGGVSVDALLADITRQEGSNYSDIAANEAYASDQRIREGAGINDQTQSRINSVGTGNFNPIIGLLQIGANAGGAYYQQKERP